MAYVFTQTHKDILRAARLKHFGNTEEHKKCPRCKRVLCRQSMFNHSRSLCNDCENERQRQYQSKRLKNGTSEYKAKVRSMNRKSCLKTRYGISYDKFKEMSQAQDNRCMICRRLPWESRINLKELCVDHDHETGKVRGLLCSQCNTALGLFSDSKEKLNAAVNYLERHNSTCS